MVMCSAILAIPLLQFPKITNENWNVVPDVKAYILAVFLCRAIVFEFFAVVSDVRNMPLQGLYLINVHCSIHIVPFQKTGGDPSPAGPSLHLASSR